MFGLILFINYLTIGINGFPNGAPIEACGSVTDIVPNHASNNASDNNNIPYSVYIDLYDLGGNNVAYMPEMEHFCKCQ